MGREISSVRIRRILSLITYLRKKGKNGAEVQELLSHGEYANKRLLQNDIKLLRDEYRAEITYKRSFPNRYCLVYEGEFLLSLNINIHDITALSIGLGMASNFVPDFKKQSRNLWNKIAELVPDSFVTVGEWLASATTMQLPLSGIKSWVFEIVIEAIYEKKVIEIDYISPCEYKKKRTHKVCPYDIFFKAHSWYMTAGEKDKVLIFNLSNIDRIAILGNESFTPPPENYDPNVFRESSCYVKNGQLKYDITLEICEPIASMVRDVMRHPTQRVKKIDDNTIELKACIQDLNGMARWILSCSPYIKVRSPEKLRIAVCKLAEKVVKLNG